MIVEAERYVGSPNEQPRAAIAIGVAGLFIETHQDPESAPSDGPNMIPLTQMEDLLELIQAFDKIAKN